MGREEPERGAGSGGAVEVLSRSRRAIARVQPPRNKGDAFFRHAGSWNENGKK